MRTAVAALLATMTVVVGPSVADAQKADPYPWCAQYGGGSFGGGTNCYFMTWGQCMAAISGNGGFCRRNLFYTGTPEGWWGPRYR